MLNSFITSLILVAIVTGVSLGIRYLLWKENEVPENISKFRWLIAFGVTAIAIMIEVTAKLEVHSAAKLLNAIILISVAQTLKNTKSDAEKESVQNILSSKDDLPTKDEYTCPNCHSPVNENHKFCAYCGADLSELVIEEEKQNISTSKSGIKIINYTCSNCNHTVNEKDKFCANCGGTLRMDKFEKE